jgi:hypothetical protein
MRSGFVREFSLTGEQGAAWMVAATVEGQAVSTTTFTASLSYPTVETILFSKTKLYIDPSSDTIGTTQKSNTLLSAELNVTTGWVAIPTGDGNLYFSSVKRVGDEIELKITFEHDASSVSEKASWLSQSERGLRLIATGNALSSAGTHGTKKLTIDLYGKWVEFEPLDDQDGNSVVTGTFRCGYSTASSAKGSIAIVNELTALP